MKARKLVDALGPVAVVGIAVALLAARPAPRNAFAACEWSVGPDHATCCACNKSGACMAVAHNGVASCTFEFCSETNCFIGPS